MAEHKFNTPPSSTNYRYGCRCDECCAAKRHDRDRWGSSGTRPRPAAVLVGTRFGKYVSQCLPYKRGGILVADCLCDCGKLRVVAVANLRRGNSKSCGCQRGPKDRNGWSRLPEYKVWDTMKQRCNNPKREGYENYGGRGISVCGRWKDSFEMFYADMGPRPGDKYSIERIDVNANYEPSNCCWATASQQAQNRRKARRLTFQGLTLSAHQWSLKMGYSRDRVGDRVRNGWSTERAILTPVRVRP